MVTKRCSSGDRCVHSEGPELPATLEYFGWRPERNTFRSQCKCCTAKKGRDYRSSNPQKYLDSCRIYRQTHPEYRREASKRYRKAHPDKIRESRQRYSAHKKGLPHNFTESHWRIALDYFNGCCAYCGNPPSLFDVNSVLHQEHHIPAIKGGGYTVENIVPACQTCNYRKHDKLPSIWLIEYFGQKQGNVIIGLIQGYFAYAKIEAALSSGGFDELEF